MIRQTGPGVQIRRIEEEFRVGNPGYWVHPEWEALFPWLAQGITGRSSGKGEGPLDFALFTDPPASRAQKSWEELGLHLRFRRVVHSRQVHGEKVSIHRGQDLSPAGTPLALGPDADGHLTTLEGILLGVTVADCVPAFLLDPGKRVVCLLHAGWRGTAAGILEKGIGLMRDEFGSSPRNLLFHLGPAICGECYEVGGEVHRALGFPDPGGPTPVDLRGHLASRAVSQGVGEERVTLSGWCTLCGGSPFFSHRRGDSGRQVGFLGIRAPEKSPGQFFATPFSTWST